MKSVDIINELLRWIEDNLDSDLSIDNISKKSGYSKWHLQRMFKAVTGHRLGHYVKARQLTNAAYILRFTNTPISEISVNYNFESQQSFTRAFKKNFGLSPGAYRREKDWVISGFIPPIKLGPAVDLAYEFVVLPDIRLRGNSYHYSYEMGKALQQRVNLHSIYWEDYLNSHDITSNVLYGLHQSSPSENNHNRKEVVYTIAQAEIDADFSHIREHSIYIERDLYVKYHYEGSLSGLQEFIIYIYTSCIVLLNITRRQGNDIEVFHRTYNKSFDLNHIVCDYLIPVKASC